MRGNTKLLVACVVAGALAVPVGAAAETATSDDAAKQGTVIEVRDGMQLDCRPLNHRDGATVGCHWSPSKAREFASYRLLRHERGEREAKVVATAQDRNATKAVDTTVERDREYLYFVQALDAQGRVIDHSNPARVSTGKARGSRPPALPGVPELPAAPGL